jgi:hypothetical protein
MLRAVLKGLARGLVVLVVVGVGWFLYRAGKVGPGGDVAGEVVVVSAEQLAGDYEADAARADALYKGRRLTIAATIKAIEVGPAIKLAGHTAYSTIWAQLKSSQSDALGRLGKGARIELACVGGGVTARTPELHDCVILP